jgi:hypothetical protein
VNGINSSDFVKAKRQCASCHRRGTQARARLFRFTSNTQYASYGPVQQMLQRGERPSGPRAAVSAAFMAAA